MNEPFDPKSLKLLGGCRYVFKMVGFPNRVETWIPMPDRGETKQNADGSYTHTFTFDTPLDDEDVPDWEKC